MVGIVEEISRHARDRRDRHDSPREQATNIDGAAQNRHAASADEQVLDAVSALG